MTIKIKRLTPSAVIPRYSHGPLEDAGMDLYADEAVVLNSGSWLAVSTGISIEMPPGIEGQIRSRSGLAAKDGVFVLNSPGTIDPGYRGEIKVILKNSGGLVKHINKGDRIAQIVFSEYHMAELEEVNEISDSLRGEGGLGSTGV